MKEEKPNQKPSDENHGPKSNPINVEEFFRKNPFEREQYFNNLSLNERKKMFFELEGREIYLKCQLLELLHNINEAAFLFTELSGVEQKKIFCSKNEVFCRDIFSKVLTTIERILDGTEKNVCHFEALIRLASELAAILKEDIAYLMPRVKSQITLSFQSLFDLLKNDPKNLEKKAEMVFFITELVLACKALKVDLDNLFVNDPAQQEKDLMLRCISGFPLSDQVLGLDINAAFFPDGKEELNSSPASPIVFDIPNVKWEKLSPLEEGVNSQARQLFLTEAAKRKELRKEELKVRMAYFEYELAKRRGLTFFGEQDFKEGISKEIAERLRVILGPLRALQWVPRPEEVETLNQKLSSDSGVIGKLDPRFPFLNAQFPPDASSVVFLDSCGQVIDSTLFNLEEIKDRLIKKNNLSSNDLPALEALGVEENYSGLQAAEILYRCTLDPVAQLLASFMAPQGPESEMSVRLSKSIVYKGRIITSLFSRRPVLRVTDKNVEYSALYIVPPEKRDSDEKPISSSFYLRFFLQIPRAPELPITSHASLMFDLGSSKLFKWAPDLLSPDRLKTLSVEEIDWMRGLEDNLKSFLSIENKLPSCMGAMDLFERQIPPSPSVSRNDIKLVGSLFKQVYLGEEKWSELADELTLLADLRLMSTLLSDTEKNCWESLKKIGEGLKDRIAAHLGLQAPNQVQVDVDHVPGAATDAENPLIFLEECLSESIELHKNTEIKAPALRSLQAKWEYRLTKAQETVVQIKDPIQKQRADSLLEKIKLKTQLALQVVNFQLAKYYVGLNPRAEGAIKQYLGISLRSRLALSDVLTRQQPLPPSQAAAWDIWENFESGKINEIECSEAFMTLYKRTRSFLGRLGAIFNPINWFRRQSFLDKWNAGYLKKLADYMIAFYLGSFNPQDAKTMQDKIYVACSQVAQQIGQHSSAAQKILSRPREITETSTEAILRRLLMESAAPSSCSTHPANKFKRTYRRPYGRLFATLRVNQQNELVCDGQNTVSPRDLVQAQRLIRA